MKNQKKKNISDDREVTIFTKLRCVSVSVCFVPNEKVTRTHKGEMIIKKIKKNISSK